MDNLFCDIQSHNLEITLSNLENFFKLKYEDRIDIVKQYTKNNIEEAIDLDKLLRDFIEKTFINL